jgi:hypothetical protein
MKNLLFLFAIVATMFASCTKDSSVNLSEQKGKKQKTEMLALVVSQDFPAGEDSIVSVDSVKYEQVGNYTGNNVFWSVRSKDIPSIQLVIQVWIEAGAADHFGVSSNNSHWATVGSLWDGGSIKTNPAAGSIFDGYPTPNETRIYRAQFIDKNGIVHYSSAYQVN